MYVRTTFIPNLQSTDITPYNRLTHHRLHSHAYPPPIPSHANTPPQPDRQLVEVLDAPLIESRVTYIKGTIMDEEALNRAGAKSAVAAFIFSDGCVRACVRACIFWMDVMQSIASPTRISSLDRSHPPFSFRLAADTEAADALTVLRVLVLKTHRPVLPCYVQLHHAHNRIQLHMLKRQRLVCIEDLKMSIMGLSALCVSQCLYLSSLCKHATHVYVVHASQQMPTDWLTTRSPSNQSLWAVPCHAGTRASRRCSPTSSSHP